MLENVGGTDSLSSFLIYMGMYAAGGAGAGPPWTTFRALDWYPGATASVGMPAASMRGAEPADIAFMGMPDASMRGAEPDAARRFASASWFSRTSARYCRTPSSRGLAYTAGGGIPASPSDFGCGTRRSA